MMRRMLAMRDDVTTANSKSPAKAEALILAHRGALTITRGILTGISTIILSTSNHSRHNFRSCLSVACLSFPLPPKFPVPGIPLISAPPKISSPQRASHLPSHHKFQSWHASHFPSPPVTILSPRRASHFPSRHSSDPSHASRVPSPSVPRGLFLQQRMLTRNPGGQRLKSLEPTSLKNPLQHRLDRGTFV
jgi:hypothetical protein